MFKNCCARPNKKICKSKSKSPNMDSLTDPSEDKKNLEINVKSISDGVTTHEQGSTNNVSIKSEKIENEEKVNECPVVPIITCADPNDGNVENDCTDEDMESRDDVVTKPYFTKKRFSIDYKKNRIQFKRFSVDCSRNVATLEELANLEKELARTNVDVRIGRRKSTGILKSTSDSGDIGDNRFKSAQESCSDDDDDVFERDVLVSDTEGPREPPATPVGRDELALRRHRFFSDLVCAARAAVEHRVRFDPLGPVVADAGKACFN